MAETKFGFQIGSALASNHLTDSKYIQGTYHVVDDITARDALKIKSGTDDGVIIKGSLVYVVDEEKTYRYDGTTYVEELSVDTTAIEEAIGKDAEGNLVKVTDRIKGEAVNAYYLIEPVGDYDEDMIPAEDWINYASARVKAMKWMIETEEGVKISSNDIFISDNGEPSCNGYTFTYDADTDVYICAALNCKIAPTEKRLYNTSETYVVEVYTYSEAIKKTIKEKIESIEVIANPTEDATETLSKVSIGETIYSLGGGDGTVTEEITVQLGDDHVGNFATGHVIAEGTTLTEVLKDMLVKRIPPTYTDPSVKITVTPALIEKDVDTEVTYTITFTKNDAGDLTEIGGEDITAGTTSPYEVKKTLNETYEQTCYAKYAEGPIKKDNLGEDYPEGHIEAGEVDSKVTVTAVYPFYYGVSNSNTVDAAFVKAGTKDLSKKGDKKYTYTANNQYLWFAYNSTYGNVTHIIDPNNFENLSDFESKTVTVGNATYKVYITTGDSAKKTCSNFTYTIKF